VALDFDALGFETFRKAQFLAKCFSTFINREIAQRRNSADMAIWISWGLLGPRLRRYQYFVEPADQVFFWLRGRNPEPRTASSWPKPGSLVAISIIAPSGSRR
jgi:hypothetical protein